MSTLERLQQLLASVLQIESRQVTPDAVISELFDRYGGDSLDQVEFVMAVEEEFGVEIPDAEAGAWEELLPTGTVHQFARWIDGERSL